MSRKKLKVNRYTINYIAWHADWNRLKDSADYTEELDYIEELSHKEIERFKKFGPAKTYERSKLLMVDPKTEDPFWTQALYFAGISIYETKVYIENGVTVYEASVDNGNIFPCIILMDFLINAFLLSTCHEKVKLILHIHPRNDDNSLENNLFASFSTIIEKYVPLHELKIDKK